MAKFTYIARFGDPVETTVMGVVFDNGVAVDVDETREMGAALANKLRTNGWFHEGEDPPPPSPLTADEVATAKGFRDQARALWLEAYRLDPEGTEADVSPPQYAANVYAEAYRLDFEKAATEVTK